MPPVHIKKTDIERKGSIVLELWDLYDKDRHPLDRLHKRGDTIPLGTYHIAVSVMTVNSKGQILITLRSKNKNPYPDLWEITAGSAVAGENSVIAAERELFEETGIKAEKSELDLVHTYISGHGCGSIVDMYIIRRDISIEDISLQEGETEAAKWVYPAEFEKMAADELVTPPVVRRYNIYKNYIAELRKE